MPSDAAPNWHQLWAFAVALGALSIGALVLFSTWRGTGESKRRLDQELPYLPATWMADDSWATNVTVLGGLVTAIFGSTDVIKPFLGDNAETSIALATVGAAIAAALVAAGPIVLFMTNKRASRKFTVIGVLAAGVVVLAGTCGEIWCVFQAVRDLDLDGAQKAAPYVTGVAYVLVLTYAWRSLLQALDQGVTKPEEQTNKLAAEGLAEVPPRERSALL